jgi:hypothetical protein
MPRLTVRRHVIAAACMALALTGCNAATTSESPEAVPSEVSSGPVTFSSEPGEKPEGRFFAVIGGETSNDNHLYELRFSPPSLQLLTETPRISSVGACRSKVVVAAGQQEVGFTDHLQELQGGALRPVDGLGAQPGFTPDLDPQCHVAYSWVDREADSQEFELRVWRTGERTAKTLYRGQRGDGPLVNPEWGPNGEVIVVRQALEPAVQSSPASHGGRPAALIIVRRDGSTSEIPVGEQVVGVTWGKQGIAVMDEQEGTVFFDSAGARRAVLSGWYPLTWSPDGEQLLVHDSGTRRTLGVVNAADLAAAKPVGKVSGPIWDVDWVPAEA